MMGEPTPDCVYYARRVAKGLAPVSLGGAVVATHLTTLTSTGNLSNYLTNTITVPANELALAWVVSCKTAGPDTPTIAGSLGGTWTEIGTGIVVDADRTLRLFRSLSGSGRTGQFQAQHATAHESCGISIVSFAGVDMSGTNGSGAIVQSGVKAAAAATAMTLDTLAAFSGSLNVCAAGVAGDVNNPFTPGAGFTELNDGGNTALDFRLQVQVAVNDETPDWSFGIRDAAAIAVEVKVAA